MAIEIIPNQPVLFRPVGWTEPCPCENCEDCLVVQDNDWTYFQLTMEPCGTDLICGPIQGGAELVENGIFDGDTGWLEAGNNWTIAGGKACYTAADGAGILYQTIAGLTVGNVYRLTFTISDYVAGTLTPFLWGNNGSAVSADGTYVQYITLTLSANSFLDFVDNAWNGCITNISIQESCWTEDYTGDSPFIYSTESVCVNGTGNLYTAPLANLPGYFVASFTISNYVSGSVQVSGACTDTWVGGPFTDNGEKFAYGVFAATGGVLCFEFTDFIGCISDVQLNILYLPEVSIINTATGAQSLILNDGIYFTISGNSITFKFKWSDLGLSHGCYTLCVQDTCLLADFIDDNVLVNPTFAAESGGWTLGDGWAMEDGVGAHYVYVDSSSTVTQVLESSDTYCAKIKVTDVIGEGALLTFSILNGLTTVASVQITTPGIYSLCGVVDRFQLAATGGTDGSGTAFEYVVEYYYASPTADCATCTAFDYCSNCINFVEAVTACTLLIEGYNNENSFGFTFVNSAGTNIFKLSHRIASKLWHPTYPEESNDYTFSDGKTSDTFAQSDKTWTLGIDPESERAHDVIRLQKRSDHLVITDINESREFWAEKGDYNPDWPDGGCKAPANIKVKLKTSTLFNNLCSE